MALGRLLAVSKQPEGKWERERARERRGFIGIHSKWAIPHRGTVADQNSAATYAIQHEIIIVWHMLAPKAFSESIFNDDYSMSECTMILIKSCLNSIRLCHSMFSISLIWWGSSNGRPAAKEYYYKSISWSGLVQKIESHERLRFAISTNIYHIFLIYINATVVRQRVYVWAVLSVDYLVEQNKLSILQH